MKSIKTGIIAAFAVLLTACGGSANKGSESDPAAKADTATEKKTLTAGSYTSDRLGYSIKYPVEVLVLQPETENTDEQVFQHKDSDAKLRIYKDERKDKDGNVLTLDKAFESDRTVSGKHQVSYSTHKPLFYIVSGVDNGTEIYYQKTIIAKGSLVTAKLTYTKNEKPVFDAMVGTLFGSFE